MADRGLRSCSTNSSTVRLTQRVCSGVNPSVSSASRGALDRISSSTSWLIVWATAHPRQKAEGGYTRLRSGLQELWSRDGAQVAARLLPLSFGDPSACPWHCADEI